MKVLHMLQSDRFSGAENVACQIISAVKDDFDSVYASQDGQIREALIERGITFSPLKNISLSEFCRIIREVKPDIIHAHDMRASFYAALTCGNIPLVSHIHNNNFNSRGLSIKSVAYMIAAKKAKHIIWVSKSAFNGYVFHERLCSKSTVLYNVININELLHKVALDTAEYHYDIAYVGRLTFPKDPERLMKVLSLVAKEKPDFRAVVIGTGDLENATKARCKELKIEKNVDFLGYQSNPLKILKCSRVMIMTSRFEGMPMCALEAMALGVPIVSTPTDGMNELIDDGKTGFLSNNDTVLANRIVEILQDNDLYEKMHYATLNESKKRMNTLSYTNTLIEIYKSAT